MNILNIEIKAWCENPEQIENILLEKKARYIGTDHQIDTYFHTTDGRLKLREGNIETSLIQYNRIETKGLKKSEVLLYKPQGDVTILKDILKRNLGVRTIVDKKRKIFFIENVKFHLDDVKGLGKFLEIEAIDESLQVSEDQLNAQCIKYIKLFKIREGDFIGKSYSDMILEQKKPD
ncbi:MAG: class IV adenylate cyclase [Bacteroidales bacterium]|nr:class IV adenylate cyclase [Bacteroidales bacterium]